MTELVQVLIDLGENLVRLITVLAKLALGHTLLIGWLVWWLWLVDWRQFWPACRRGAWLPLLLALGLVSYLAWLVGAPLPAAETFGALTPLTTCLLLFASVLLCGWVQTVFAWYPVEISLEPPASAAHGAHDGHAASHSMGNAHGTPHSHTHHETHH